MKNSITVGWLLLLVSFTWLGIISDIIVAENNESKTEKKIILELKNGQKIEGILINYKNGTWYYIKGREGHNKVNKVSESEVSKAEIVYSEPAPSPVPPLDKKMAPADKPSKPVVADPELQSKINELIKKLGNDNWQVREEATQELEKIGKGALDSLKEANQNTDDPEIKWRAKLLIDSITGVGHKKHVPPAEEEEWIWGQIQGPNGVVVQLNPPPDIDFPPTESLELFEKAMKLLMAGKHEKAIEVFKEITEKLDTEEHDFDNLKATCEYNIACGYSLLKKTGEAIKFLDAAIKNGFTNYDHMRQDPDLDNIRGEEGYKKLVEPDSLPAKTKSQTPQDEKD